MLSVARLDEVTAGSVGGIPPLEYWNELVCGTFTGLIVDAPEPAEFRARMRRAAVGDCVFATPFATRSVVRHTNEHVRMASDESFLIHMQLAGHSMNEQRGRQAQLGPGDFTLCTTSAPYVLHLLDPEVEHLVVRLPAKSLRARLAHPEDFTSVAIPGAVGMGAVAGTCLRSLWREIVCGRLDPVPGDLMDTVLDLVSAACRMQRRTSPNVHDRRAYRRQQLLDYVRSRIRDPNLSVSSVAEALGMSVRNISKLMSDDGYGLAAYILERRLEGCASWLRDPSRANLRVSDVAYQWGFGDLSHFSRSFRARFGVSPKAFRQGLSGVFATLPPRRSDLADA